MKESWDLRYDKATERLHIVARGHATGAECVRACARFRELLGEKTVDLVVDLEQMTGYTTEARRAWQDCFYPARAQLRRMLVVGQDIPVLVRMGATVVAAFSGIPVQFFPSHEKLEERERRGGVA